MNSIERSPRTDRAEQAINALGVYLWEATPSLDRLRIDDKARELLGIPGEGATTISALDHLAHLEDGPGVFEAIEAATSDGRDFVVRRRFTMADGSVRWWEIRGEVFSSGSETERVLAGWMRDVHDEQMRVLRVANLDRELLHRHRLETLEGCVDEVAHEFKNVLQIIRGYLSFAKKGLPVGAGPANDIEQALVATNRAAEVANQLLITAKCEDCDRDVCDVNDLLADMAQLLQPILGAEIEVAVAVAVDSVAVTGLEASIRQMLVNLCLNARDAMPRGGRILLRAERFTTVSYRDDIGRGLEPGEYARVFVTDNGCGMSSDQLEKLFEPYFTTKRTQDGTGLGLSVVRQLAESAGGGVSVHSEEGVGTTFTLFLPLQVLNDDEAAVLLPEEQGDLLLLGSSAANLIDPLTAAGWHVHTPDPNRRPDGSSRATHAYRAVLIAGQYDQRLKEIVAELAPGAPVARVEGFDPESVLVDISGSDIGATLSQPIDTTRLMTMPSPLATAREKHSDGAAVGPGLPPTASLMEVVS